MTNIYKHNTNVIKVTTIKNTKSFFLTKQKKLDSCLFLRKKCKYFLSKGKAKFIIHEEKKTQIKGNTYLKQENRCLSDGLWAAHAMC